MSETNPLEALLGVFGKEDAVYTESQLHRLNLIQENLSEQLLKTTVTVDPLSAVTAILKIWEITNGKPD